jgi:hypothetical protein
MDERQNNGLSKSDAGQGLLGFTSSKLSDGDFAYFSALGLSKLSVLRMVVELRRNMQPQKPLKTPTCG